MKLNRDVLTALIAAAFTHFEKTVRSMDTDKAVFQPLPFEVRDAYLSNPMIHLFTDHLVNIIVTDHWGDPSKWKAVYIAANRVLMQVGYEGNIESDHPSCDELMHALYEIDGGVFDAEAVFGEKEASS